MSTDEVDALRARVAELEAQLEAARSGAPSPPGAAAQHRVGWRSVLSAVLITLASVLAPLSVASTWASTQISDTEQYVNTVAPLADDPEVQRAISNEVTAAVFEGLDIEGLTTQALSAIAEQPNVPPRVASTLPALAVPITNGIRSFARDQVATLVASPQFAQLWAEVNRAAHEQVVVLLEGRQGGVVSAQGDTVTLNLAPIIDRVKQRLVDQGFGLASNIPTVQKSFVLVRSEGITRAQGLYRLANTLGTWLPVTAFVAFAIGVALARDRRKALMRGALGVAAAMLVLGVGLTIARTWYVGSRPTDLLSDQGAGDVFDTVVAFLRTGVRATEVLALLVALGAFVAGPSRLAVRTRSVVRTQVGALRGEAEKAGWQSGRVGVWVFAHRRALQAATVVGGGLLLVFWTRPTVGVILLIGVLVVVGLLVVEFLGRPPRAPTSAEDSSGPGGGMVHAHHGAQR